MDDLFSVAKSHLTAQECAFVLRQMPIDRERAFVRCWTSKEACVKGLGKGLSIPFNSFDTVMFNGESIERLGEGPGSIDSETWQLADIKVPEGYMAAVAVESVCNALVHFEWRTDLTRSEAGAGVGTS